MCIRSSSLKQFLVQQVSVYGIVGRKGAGKDTVADILRQSKLEDTNHKFVQLAFADTIKEVCTTLFGFPSRKYFDDPLLKEKVHAAFSDKTPRSLMQWFGTEVVRDQLGDRFWIERLQTEIKNKVREFSSFDRISIVVTDVRFPNEAKFLESELEATMIYIDAEGRLGPMQSESHSSESSVYESKAACANILVVYNNGTLADLKRATLNIDSFAN
jgi:hypothetical protein